MHSNSRELIFLPRPMRPDPPPPRSSAFCRGPAKIQNFFYEAPAAGSVQLVGDFTGWLERPIALKRGPEGVWWKAVRLAPGTHYYRFLVDGEWRDDPHCQHFRPNPFGSMDAIRQVP